MRTLLRGDTDQVETEGAEQLKPEDAAAGGEYVGMGDAERAAASDARERLVQQAGAQTVVVDGESIPPWGECLCLLLHGLVAASVFPF